MNEKLDVCVGRSPDLLDVPNDFKSLTTVSVNDALTARGRIRALDAGSLHPGFAGGGLGGKVAGSIQAPAFRVA